MHTLLVILAVQLVPQPALLVILNAAALILLIAATAAVAACQFVRDPFADALEANAREDLANVYVYHNV